MQYTPDELAPRERYKVLTAFVLPRPIAWVTTIGPTGVVNAAPFSFFNVVGGVGWVGSLTLAGYWFGNLPWIQKNLTLVIVAMSSVTTRCEVIGVYTRVSELVV